MFPDGVNGDDPPRAASGSFLAQVSVIVVAAAVITVSGAWITTWVGHQRLVDRVESLELWKDEGKRFTADDGERHRRDIDKCLSGVEQLKEWRYRCEARVESISRATNSHEQIHHP